MVEAVDKLIFKVKNQDIWKIVDFCLKVWATRNPVEHKEYLKELARYRKTRANKYAATKDHVWRELVIIPPLLNYLLEKIAFDRIENYGRKKFYREFARRYPGFRPGERL